MNAGYVGLYLIFLSKPQNYTSKGTKYVKQYSENENETTVKAIKVEKRGRREGQNNRFENATLLGFEDGRGGHETRIQASKIKEMNSALDFSEA